MDARESGMVGHGEKTAVGILPGMLRARRLSRVHGPAPPGAGYENTRGLSENRGRRYSVTTV